jgi:hypothetical protein
LARRVHIPDHYHQKRTLPRNQEKALYRYDQRACQRFKERFITLMSTEYTPIISYTVDGIEYTCKFTKAYVPDTYQTGQTVEIKYNPDKPKEINAKGDSNKSDYVFLGVTIVIAIIGYVLLRFF